jgi:ribulose-bisphosphate carboxylase large chain
VDRFVDKRIFYYPCCMDTTLMGEYIVANNSANQVLAQNWGSLKPVLAVASGGLHPGHVPSLMRILGRDIVMQFGGGVHAHPQGSMAGAKAVRQAIDAVMAGSDLVEYARSHLELRQVLDVWR